MTRRAWFRLIGAGVVVLALLLLMLGNQERVTFRFIVPFQSTPLSVVVIISFLVGTLAGIVGSAYLASARKKRK